MTSKFLLRPRVSLRLMLILMAAVAVVLGGLSYRVKRQQASVAQLRRLGGQLESPTLDFNAWLTGISVESVQFLGPSVGDEMVDEIANAAGTLDIRRITFMETRLTLEGRQKLQDRLPSVVIQPVTVSPGVPFSVPIR